MDAIHIDRKGNYFMGIRGRYNVFWSTDQGLSWKDVTSDRGGFLEEKVFFEDTIGNLFLSNSRSSSLKLSKWDQDRFITFDDHKFKSSYANLIFSKDGSIYHKSSRDLYKLNADWSIDSTAKLASFKNSISNISFFYNDTSNFLVIRTTNPGSSNSSSIYQLNSKTGDTALISIWPENLGETNIQITEKGNILIAAFQDGLMVSDENDPFRYHRIEVDTITRISSVLRIGKTTKGQLFVRTSNGIYINYGPSLHEWTRCNGLSQSISTGGTIIVYDSLTAMILETEDCLRKQCRLYSARTGSWTKPEIDLSVYSLSNLSMSREGIMYGLMDCHAYQSKDTGQSWEVLLVNSTPVTFLTINHLGQPVALAGPQIYVYDDSKKEWFASPTTLAARSNMLWMNFYCVGQNLFLEGLDESSGRNYRIHTEDGGINWRATTAFNYGFLLTAGIPDIKVADSSEWLAIHLLKDSVMISYDKGLVWQSYNLFKNFRAYSNLFKLPDNSYLIHGAYNQSPGLYHLNRSGEVLKELINFEGVSFIEYYPPSGLVGFNFFDNGIVISNNLAEDVIESKEGLPNKHPDKIEYADFLFNGETAYFSNKNDGIYTLHNPFGETGVQTKDNQKVFLFYVYNSGRQFYLISELADSEFANYSLLDIMGKYLASGVLSGKITSLDLTYLPSGVYLIRIRAKGSIKTIKIILE